MHPAEDPCACLCPAAPLTPGTPDKGGGLAMGPDPGAIPPAAPGAVAGGCSEAACGRGCLDGRAGCSQGLTPERQESQTCSPW